ncbi:prepilin-type N-terminal cleavage/methylation domain-containing protein [Kiritimatiellaeota bacterium B1221]|nr:prepilin-type N-terminal cleavage/methylation domain-containing protein [Kiritimatiellaeota bacterium B1221]
MLKRRGFTLIEMLVVISIILLLSSLMIPGISKVRKKAGQVREQSAGRSLAQAYMLYSTENLGRYLPGYADEAAKDSEGNAIPHPINARYPWRLAPYLNYNINGAFLLYDSGDDTSDEDEESYQYRVSVYPALGMNLFYVGGDESGTSGQGLKPIPAHEAIFGKFCVTGMGQAVSPSNLILFASAQHENEGKNEAGFHKITSPNFTQSQWGGAWDPDANPSEFGFVDLRWSGRAVTVMLDGSVRMMDEAEMRDMRHWSNLAAEENDPDWKLSRL